MYIAKQERADRFKIVSDAQALINGAGAKTPEILAQFDAMMADADLLKEQIDRIERVHSMHASMTEVIGQSAETKGISRGQEEDALAKEKRLITALLRRPLGEMNSADRDAIMQRFQPSNVVTTSTSDTSQAGLTIAPLFWNSLAVAMKAQGGMRTAATVITTDTGANLPFPTFDDRNNVATIVATEGTAITEDSQQPVFGQITIGAYTYKSGSILVSLQMLNDSAFDFEQQITTAMASRFVRGQNPHFTKGTGSGQPRGLLTAAASGVVGATGLVTATNYTSLVGMVHAVDPYYRTGASWMLHDSAIKGLRLLLDGQNRPLWQPGLVDNAPDTLLGYPIVTNQDMPVMAAGAKSILFGNMKSYYIRDVATSLQMVVLRERYADQLAVGFIAWARSDGNLVSAATPVVYFQNAAS